MRNPWNKLLEFETRDLVERFIQKKYGRQTSAKQVLEITSNFIQTREYFINSQKADITVKPLLQFYGVASMTKGLILILSPKKSETDLKSSHGLETLDWKNTLPNRNFEELTIKIKNGTFHDLLKVTSNSTYFRNNSSMVTMRYNYEIPKTESKIKLANLVASISDLSEEYKTWTQKKLYYTNLVSFNHISKNNIYSYSVGAPVKISDELKIIFPQDVYGRVKIDGFKVEIDDSITPQFSQRNNDPFNTGIGKIVLTKVIDKEIRLNTLSQLYSLSYYMGMLCRYFPSIWISMGRSSKGDSIYPLFVKSIQLIDKHFPEAILEFLASPYDFENNGK